MVEQCNYCGKTHETGEFSFHGQILKMCPEVLPSNGFKMSDKLCVICGKPVYFESPSGIGARETPDGLEYVHLYHKDEWQRMAMPELERLRLNNNTPIVNLSVSRISDYLDDE